MNSELVICKQEVLGCAYSEMVPKELRAEFGWRQNLNGSPVILEVPIDAIWDLKVVIAFQSCITLSCRKGTQALPLAPSNSCSTWAAQGKWYNVGRGSFLQLKAISGKALVRNQPSASGEVGVGGGVEKGVSGLGVAASLINIFYINFIHNIIIELSQNLPLKRRISTQPLQIQQATPVWHCNQKAFGCSFEYELQRERGRDSKKTIGHRKH